IAGSKRQLRGHPQRDTLVIAETIHSDYREGTSLADMIREDLVAERIAIETYREIVHYFGEQDSTSRLLMEDILANEEKHADELANLLFAVEPETVAVPSTCISATKSPHQPSLINLSRHSGGQERWQLCYGV